MGPIDALKLAMGKEIEAAQMYSKFSKKFPAAKEIYIFLMSEEEKHQQLIEKKISEMTR